ncbi:MAG TPA: hypothetical protein VNO70_13195, partial [Blastocatellia bacterium]|nr:hypothetical protein [Blastocatellia bacterium]
EAAKSRMFLAVAEKLRTSDGTADLILDMELYGLGRDYLIHYADRVNAITPADIQRAAQKILTPGSAAVAVAGPVGKFECDLKKLGMTAAAQ